MIDVGPLTPLDAFERRAEWEFAALVVALTVIPIAAAPEPSRTRPASNAAAAKRRRTGRNRGIRPPRSC